MMGNTANSPLNSGPSIGDKWVTETVNTAPAIMRVQSSMDDELAGPTGWVSRGNTNGARITIPTTMTTIEGSGGAK